MVWSPSHLPGSYQDVPTPPRARPTLASRGRCAMSLLSEALNEYVAMRRNLGFVFRVPASLLRTFVAFVDQAGSPVITTELARQWALQPTGAQPSTWAGRLAI